MNPTAFWGPNRRLARIWPKHATSHAQLQLQFSKFVLNSINLQLAHRKVKTSSMEHITDAVGHLLDSVLCFPKTGDDCGASLSMPSAAAPVPASVRARRKTPGLSINVNEGRGALLRQGSFSSEGSDSAAPKDFPRDYPGRCHMRVARNAHRQCELASQAVRKLSASVIAKSNEVNALKVHGGSPTGNTIRQAQFELAEIKSAIKRERRAMENAREIEESTREAAIHERMSGSVVVFSCAQGAGARPGTSKDASKARKGA